MKTLRVRATGRATAAPDRVTVSFHVSASSPEYGVCVEALNRRAADLRAGLAKFDISESALKTTDFDVSTESKFRNNEHVFVGYKASHRLAIKLPLDKERLNGVLRVVARGQSHAEITLRFSVSDQTSMHEQALRNAVAAGKRNASVLADAAGSALGQLQKVDYSWDELRIEDRESTLQMAEMPDEQDSDVDVNADDLSASASVTLEYELR